MHHREGEALKVFDPKIATKHGMEIEKLQTRLDEVGRMIETNLDDVRILLTHFERVADHCRRSLASVDKSPERSGEEEVTRLSDDISPDDAQARGSLQPTDKPSSEKRINPSPSTVTSGTLSVLEARELFPHTPSPDDSQGSSSSGSSSPSPRTHTVRKIIFAREQQVRAIMRDMQKRMKGVHST